MRKLILGEFKEPPLAGSEHKALLMEILKSPANPQEGVKYDEMLQVLPIIQKLTQANGELLLEEAEWTALVHRAKIFPFNATIPEIFAFIKQLIETPEIKVREDRIN